MSHWSRTKRLLLLMLLLFLPSVTSRTQDSGHAKKEEQSSFGTEDVPGTPRVVLPLPVPDSVVQSLETDENVRSCLQENPLDPGQSLGSWFIASEIHLAGPAEDDLVVVPSFKSSESMCFQSVAGIGWFWVFRRVDTRYQLALKAAGNGLEVLGTRSSGYRDIQTSTLGQAGRHLTTMIFRFDGTRYQKYRETTH